MNCSRNVNLRPQQNEHISIYKVALKAVKNSKMSRLNTNPWNGCLVNIREKAIWGEIDKLDSFLIDEIDKNFSSPAGPFSPEDLLIIYKSQFYFTIEYCSHILDGTSNFTLNLLLSIPRRLINQPNYLCPAASN